MRIIRNCFVTYPAAILRIREFEKTAAFEPGRQGGNYGLAVVPADLCPSFIKHCLSQLTDDPAIDFDCFLIFYPEGSWVPRHVDPLDGREHHRLNVLITEPIAGGQLIVNRKRIKLRAFDGYVFRPDLEPHEVESIVMGERLVFSVGIAQ